MIIRYHRNLATALVDLFPDVRFEKSNLSMLTPHKNNNQTNKREKERKKEGMKEGRKERGRRKEESNNSYADPNPWHNIATRRKFFEEYAKKNHFDPLNPECWYNAKTKEIRTLPVC